MTKKQAEAIVHYIDTAITYAVERLRSDFRTSTSGPKTTTRDLNDAKRKLLQSVKSRSKTKKVKANSEEYERQQFENPAFRDQV